MGRSYQLRRLSTPGEDWQVVNAEAWRQSAEDIVVLPTGETVLFGVDSLYVYSDQLQRLPNLETPASRKIRDMSVSSNGTLAYLAEHLGVSDDGGDTWTTYNRPDGSSSAGQIVVYNSGTICYFRQTRTSGESRVLGYTLRHGATDYEETEILGPSAELLEVRDAQVSRDGLLGLSTQFGYFVYSDDTCRSYESWNLNEPGKLFDLNSVFWDGGKKVVAAGDGCRILSRDFQTTSVLNPSSVDDLRLRCWYSESSNLLTLHLSADVRFIDVTVSAINGEIAFHNKIPVINDRSRIGLPIYLAAGIYVVAVTADRQRSSSLIYVIR